MALVKPLSLLVHLGDPQQNLAETLASRPVQHGLEELGPDTLAAKAGIYPERGQRRGAVELPLPPSDRADDLAVDLRDESRSFGDSVPPAFLTRFDLGFIGRTKRVGRLLQRGKPDLAKDLPVVRPDATDLASCRG